jgi:superfamily II DNA or RNA helicase
MTELYNYQVEAVNKTDQHQKGIFVLPTGTGKTMIQAAIIEKFIGSTNQFKMFVVNGPRIILTYQLLKEVYTYMVERGIECRYHFVHSGSALDISDLEDLRKQSDVPFSQIGSTTSSIELTKVMEETRELGIPLVIFSTYHSADRIEQSRRFINQPISVVFNDEAHYLVQETFYDKLIGKINTERQYFFTATMRVNDSDDDTDLDNYETQEGRGMFNVDSYGRVIYKLLPRDAIEMGKMVRPRIHLVGTDGVRTDEDFNRSLNKVIHNSFNSQVEHFKKFHPNIVPKIIVATRGASDIKPFLDSNEYTLLRENGVEVFAIMSDKEEIIGNDINGNKVTRQKFLKRIKEVGKDKTKMMLVLHYDILTEGIDVPGLTSCMPIRNLNKSRFIQTLGRCSRLDSDDRTKLENGEIDWTDINSMNKPYAYIILPEITLTNKEDKKQMSDFVLQLRDYGFKPFEDIIRDAEPLGLPEEDEMDVASSPDRRPSVSGRIIDFIRDEFENEEIANLTEDEWLELHLNN